MTASSQSSWISVYEFKVYGLVTATACVVQAREQVIHVPYDIVFEEVRTGNELT
jgi:hypothetical protein